MLIIMSQAKTTDVGGHCIWVLYHIRNVFLGVHLRFVNHFSDFGLVIVSWDFLIWTTSSIYIGTAGNALPNGLIT